MPPDLTFGRQKRLTSTAHFDQVRKHGRKVRGVFISLGVLRVDKEGPVRAGFVTSRRIGSAVKRNRLRRRLREIVRRHQADLVPGIWIVVIAQPGTAAATYQQLEVEWLRLASRASILAA